MKNSLIMGMAIALGITAQVSAQSPTQTTSEGVMTRSARQLPATSSTTGMQRRGSGKMSSGVTRNGNSNLSPTAPTNTQGSTSEGTAGKASPGGAAGTNVKETKLPGTAGGTRTTRSAAGAKVGSATDAGLTNSRSGDALNTTRNSPKVSPTATKSASQSAQSSSVSTSGKTSAKSAPQPNRTGNQ